MDQSQNALSEGKERISREQRVCKRRRKSEGLKQLRDIKPTDHSEVS